MFAHCAASLAATAVGARLAPAGHQLAPVEQRGAQRGALRAGGDEQTRCADRQREPDEHVHAAKPRTFAFH